MLDWKLNTYNGNDWVFNVNRSSENRKSCCLLPVWSLSAVSALCGFNWWNWKPTDALKQKHTETELTDQEITVRIKNKWSVRHMEDTPVTLLGDKSVCRLHNNDVHEHIVILKQQVDCQLLSQPHVWPLQRTSHWNTYGRCFKHAVYVMKLSRLCLCNKATCLDSENIQKHHVFN